MVSSLCERQLHMWTSGQTEPRTVILCQEGRGRSNNFSLTGEYERKEESEPGPVSEPGAEPEPGPESGGGMKTICFRGKIGHKNNWLVKFRETFLSSNSCSFTEDLDLKFSNILLRRVEKGSSCAGNQTV